MKKILNAIFATILASTMILSSCSDISTGEESGGKESASEHKETVVVENPDSEIVLGEKFDTLFSVWDSSSRNAVDEEASNFFYFRCRSDDDEKIAWLSEKFDFISTIPLDQDIIESGSYYVDSELSEGEAPWFYFMCGLEDYNEVVAQGFTVEILDETYLDDEDYSILHGEGLEIPEDTYLTVEVENDSSRGLFKRIKKFIKKYVANCPHGKVKVYDTVIGDYVPVQGAQVISHQAGIIGIAVTDKNGNFNIPVPYTSLAGKVQIAVRFSNSNLSIVAPTASPKVLYNLTGADMFIEGSHWIEGISSLRINIKDDLHNARNATIFNAYGDYCDYCRSNGVNEPKKLNVLAITKIGSACTPLLSYTSGVKINSDLLRLLIPTASFALSPDIILGVANATDKNYTKNIYSNMFHELSHASHYFGLGTDGRRSWFNEYHDILSGWIKVAARGEDINDNCYNNGGTNLVKLVESWGYFSGNYIMEWKYPDIKTKVKRKIGVTITDVEVSYYYEKLENRKLDTNIKDGVSIRDKSKPYFYYGGLYDLIDSDNIEYDDAGNPKPVTVDFCSGYTYNNLYKALTSSGVRNLTSFANALVRVTGRYSDLPNVIKTLEANHD